METQETTDNTTAVSRILASNDVEGVKLILGDRERVQHAGVVRPGIKVPLASCSDKEKEIYTRMYAEGKGFDEIDAALGGNVPIQGQQGKFSKSKLRPSNCDYFRVCRSDFRNPADADMIMQKYADPATGHLYRIPIWFPHDTLHLIVPHGYRGFGGDGSVKCYSEFDEKGQLICHYIPQAEQEAARKDKRRPQFTTRICDQTTCASYEKKRCDFGGLLRFNVPGMRSLGGVIMPTTSIHGLSEIIASLKSLLNPDLFGRFSGLFNGEPFLELCKFQKEVTAPDGSRQVQWVPTVELSVDPMELARHAERKLERGAMALRMFNDKPTAEAFAAQHITPTPAAVTPEPQTTEATTGAAAGPDPAIQQAMDAIHALATKHQLTAEEADAWLKKQIGESPDINTLRTFYADFRTLLATPDGVSQVKSLSQEPPLALDLEISAMWDEIGKLADAHDIPVDAIKGWLTANAFGVMPEDLALEDLQRGYRDIEAELKKDAAKFVAALKKAA